MTPSRVTNSMTISLRTVSHLSLRRSARYRLLTLLTAAGLSTPRSFTKPSSAYLRIWSRVSANGASSSAAALVIARAYRRSTFAPRRSPGHRASLRRGDDRQGVRPDIHREGIVTASAQFPFDQLGLLVLLGRDSHGRDDYLFPCPRICLDHGNPVSAQERGDRVRDPPAPPGR